MSPSISSDGMIRLAGGQFAMGSDRFYPEESPVRLVSVSPFAIDETPVTNAQFATFVAETGHNTCAEIAPDPKHYPGMSPDMARPGSLVFVKRAGHIDLSIPSWWDFCFDANWRQPLGPGSKAEDDHPVVHVTHSDAAAFAAWAGKALPTEAEWEFAARGGLQGMDYAWGAELEPGGERRANYWQGAFPAINELSDGWEFTSPVRTFPPNGYGLYDMIGNVWEWTADWYADAAPHRKKNGGCCIPQNPGGGTRGGSIDRREAVRIPRKVMKGGSHLCAENYCQRYRPAARYAQSIDTSTSHVGFRCVIRETGL
jgi:formylglycine-generating enzyme required for sulfatase activity